LIGVPEQIGSGFAQVALFTNGGGIDKQIEKVPAGSAARALQGKVAGVSVTNLGRPGQGATLLLRGAANFYGSQAPLVLSVTAF